MPVFPALYTKLNRISSFANYFINYVSFLSTLVFISYIEFHDHVLGEETKKYYENHEHEWP